jgi:hypothetical protein
MLYEDFVYVLEKNKEETPNFGKLVKDVNEYKTIRKIVFKVMTSSCGNTNAKIRMTTKLAWFRLRPCWQV